MYQQIFIRFLFWAPPWAGIREKDELFVFKYFLIKEWLIYNVMPIFAIQQSDPYIDSIPSFFYIIFKDGLFDAHF